MKKKRKILIRLAAAVLAAGLFCLIAGSGALYQMDNVVSDALYQSEEATDNEIMVVGMDQRAMIELGAWPWSRKCIADAIDFLNSDPENKPAVIAIDTMYVGESDDPEADAALVEACRKGGNVVMAAAATFGSELQVEEEVFYMAQKQVLAWDQPFEALREVTEMGHINAMLDQGKILRHALLYVDVPGVGRVYSLPRVVYEKYCEVHGIEPNPLPKVSEGYDSQGFYYLPYSKVSGGYYEGVSVAALVDHEVDTKYFAGKIVLIGPYTYGFGDEYQTAIDHSGATYGVEVMANEIENFRTGFYPDEVPEGLQLFLLFVICFGMLLFFYDRHVLKALAAELAVVIAWILLCIICYRCGLIFHVLWVPLFVTILFIACVALNYVRAALEKRRVQNTFGHYVDPSIMQTLLDQGSSALELGGKMYDIAVLFVDVRGFTTMSENLDPPTVVEIVNRYLTLTTECIIKNHGVLDKFVGDC
ncbi:MAG: adenylate/guanylate cyclase domain-containing protein, partial [Lachnospiraceae bacterium]|nr:adenylate/guanylate cyclase domain-containing protein [Lachnospiraceae bacterium]